MVLSGAIRLSSRGARGLGEAGVAGGGDKETNKIGGILSNTLHARASSLSGPDFFDSSGRGTFLFAGISEGDFLLRLVLKDASGYVMSKDVVYISLKKIRHLFRAFNARAIEKGGQAIEKGGQANNVLTAGASSAKKGAG